MKHTLTFFLCVFILGCGKINTSPEFFKPDEKCYVVVESSFSLNEKFKDLLEEAIKDNNNITLFIKFTYIHVEWHYLYQIGCAI